VVTLLALSAVRRYEIAASEPSFLGLRNPFKGGLLKRYCILPPIPANAITPTPAHNAGRRAGPFIMIPIKYAHSSKKNTALRINKHWKNVIETELTRNYSQIIKKANTKASKNIMRFLLIFCITTNFIAWQFYRWLAASKPLILMALINFVRPLKPSLTIRHQLLNGFLSVWFCYYSCVWCCIALQ